MSSASSHEVSSMMPLQPAESPSPFWQLLALLAGEPDLRWLDWVLRQRGAAPSPARAETTAGHTEELSLHSRSLPDIGAALLEEESLSSGGAAGGHRCIVDDCPLCRSEASRHFGPQPLEALGLLERSAHPRIWRIYRQGLSRFLAFREEAGLPSAWPVPVEEIRAFLGALDSQHLPSLQILGYLSGLSYIARMFHFPDPLQDFGVSHIVMALNRRRDVQRRG
ncbi:UNVERIFIED_CONTAM: hypothetical protein K2H54_057070 [Gekko kuhli]